MIVRLCPTGSRDVCTVGPRRDQRLLTHKCYKRRPSNVSPRKAVNLTRSSSNIIKHSFINWNKSIHNHFNFGDSNSHVYLVNKLTRMLVKFCRNLNVSIM